MSKSLSKKELISEIAEQTGLKKKEAEEMLNSLRDIAYREARNGFTIPGICKLKVARKKASKCRNPATGQMMLIDEHDILKTTPLKKAKDAVAPKDDDIVHIIEDEKAEPEAGYVDKDEDTEKAKDQEPGISEASLLFYCSVCGQELEAPASMRGMEAECPTCQNNIIVGEHTDKMEQDSGDNVSTDGDKGETGELNEDEKEELTNTVKIDLSSLGLS